MMFVHDLFRRRAAAAPRTVAVVDERRTLTYGELDAMSDRLACELIDRGARPERLVAVCMGRSLEFVVTALAVLESGAAYLPLDPSYPSERLTGMLSDADPCVTVTRASDGAALSPGLSYPTVSFDALDPYAPLAAATARHPFVRPVSARHLAYVMYTSVRPDARKA